MAKFHELSSKLKTDLDLRSLILPSVAAAYGALSPLLPRISGEPFLALGGASVLAFAVPYVARKPGEPKIPPFGESVLFIFVWAVAFTLSSLYI